jgi:hypothetical protein
LYGQGLEVLKGNLEAQRKQAEGQLSVWRWSLKEAKRKEWWQIF